MQHFLVDRFFSKSRLDCLFCSYPKRAFRPRNHSTSLRFFATPCRFAFLHCSSSLGCETEFPGARYSRRLVVEMGCRKEKSTESRQSQIHSGSSKLFWQENFEPEFHIPRAVAASVCVVARSSSSSLPKHHQRLEGGTPRSLEDLMYYTA